MSNLVVVPFDDKEGRLEGDSSWNPGIFFPYEEGMTAKDVTTKAIVHLMKLWEEYDAFDGDVEAFTKEYTMECTGGWVIEKDKLDVINGCSFDVGNDSALYAMMNALKSQVAGNATKVIE